MKSLFTILFGIITMITFAFTLQVQAADIQFRVQDFGNGQGEWSFSSDEARPMLYLVSVKAGPSEPKNCDDGQAVYAVRDILTYDSRNFDWPQASSATVQLCVLNLHGFVEKRSILSFRLR